MSRLQTPIRRNDTVSVNTGKDSGKRGRVLKVLPTRNRLIVEGVNMIKRHTRPNPSKNIAGGISEKEAPLHVSNVMLVDPDRNHRHVDDRQSISGVPQLLAPQVERHARDV